MESRYSLSFPASKISSTYKDTELELIGYTDADWAGDLDHRKSTSAYVFLLNGGAISWASKKQTCVALSTMEAEFVAAASAVQEGVWLRRFLHHLGVSAFSMRPVTIFCDNQAAIAYTKDPKYHSKTKHIDIKFNFIRDIVQQNEVNLKYITTHQMVADPLTKPIACDVYGSHIRVMRLYP